LTDLNLHPLISMLTVRTQSQEETTRVNEELQSTNEKKIGDNKSSFA